MTIAATARLNLMRGALARCKFPPRTSAKRFARQVGSMVADSVTPAQWDTIVLLAYRFRRQMPADLVPTPHERHFAQRNLDLRAAARAAEREERLRQRAARRKPSIAEPGPAPLLDAMTEATSC